MATTRLGELLKTTRRERALTLAQVGAALGLANGNFIGMVERGERMPSDERLLALADVLGIDGRHAMALKYEESRGAATEILLRPPDPELPRLRKALLSLCDDHDEVAAEFARGERTALERVVFAALLEYVVLPGLQADRFAPRRIRDRVLKHHKRRGVEGIDPWWFEEEAEAFVPWLRQAMISWSFEVATLTLRIRHSRDGGDISTLPLIDRELRQRMLVAAGAQPAPPDLPSVLRAEGLPPQDVEEILALVAFKKSRIARDAG